MVKAPRARHSKGDRQPVTIDLGAGDVTRIDEGDSPEFVSSVSEAEPEAAGAGENPRATPEEQDDGAAEIRDDEQSSDQNGENGGRVPPASEEPVTPNQMDITSRRSGGGSALAAGVAGGVIALLIAGGLQWAGVIPGLARNANGQQIRTLESDVAALKQGVAAVKNAPPDNGIASLKQALDQASQKISQQAAALDQLRAAQAKTDAGANQAVTTQLKDLGNRLSKLESIVKANASGEAGLTALDQKVSGQAKSAQANRQALASQSQQIGKLEQTVAALSQKVAVNAEQPKVALAIAASALKSAVERGTPFVSELDTYASLAPHSPELDALRKLAPAGVPTREEIVAEVGSAADAMVAAGRPVEKSNGILNDLVESARSLVKVRPVGEVSGTGVGATVARIEVDIRAGDFAKAVQEYKTLPQNVQSAGSAFFAKVQTQLQAENLVQKTLANALKTG
jgi:hypothetical protein